jgi:hypothetical protein
MPKIGDLSLITRKSRADWVYLPKQDWHWVIAWWLSDSSQDC